MNVSETQIHDWCQKKKKIVTVNEISKKKEVFKYLIWVLLLHFVPKITFFDTFMLLSSLL